MTQRTRRQGGDTANQTAAKLRRAETRKCPKCGRKGATKYHHDQKATICRWVKEGKCDYIAPLF